MTITGLGRTTIYKLIKEGQLRPVHVGRRVLFVATELHAWIANLPRAQY